MTLRRGLALAACVLLTGCGIPTEDVPRAIGTDPTASAAPSLVVPSGSQTAQVYLVRDDRLVAVDRQVPLQASAGELLAVLEGGPQEDEARDGFSSLVPTDSRLASARGGVVVVEVPGQSSNEDRLLFGQVVLTLDASGDDAVTGVLFSRDGTQLTGVPKGDGSLGSGPLRRSDYAALVGIG